ncbi:uncharacterized protein LOC123664566 [Melitaea cinxia]|uniref:uncharacterized protein LOC123664566 n=1 Tax=Melitaea cinxia TaxID=113334 RepID=UPI001E2729D5|nr:uncharacterized protein LOC123664566 [Melitaea cinxia]
MDNLPNFKSISWCKPHWELPNITDQNKSLLQQCTSLSTLNLSDDVDEIIEKSKAFPIEFPIQTVRLINLKSQRPIERLRRNVTSTYPVIHERVLILMTKFLEYKRLFGSVIEKALYEKMTVPELIDRILKKRAVCFVGPRDKYLLLSGKRGAEGWEEIGTTEEKPPLILENCLSYDEMKLSSMVYVSGYTECINDGSRFNKGKVVDNCEQEAIIIGLVGPRFRRRGKMDYEDIIIIKQQNCPENGYGEESKSFLKIPNQETDNRQAAKYALRELWAEFYQVCSNLEALQFLSLLKKNICKNNDYTQTFVYLRKGNLNSIFNNEVYYKRICVIAETTLIEAEHRAKECGKNAFVNVVGCGLGVWMVSKHQPDVYVLTFLERIKSFLSNNMLNHVTDINFAYIKDTSNVVGMFQNSNEVTKTSGTIFLKSETHPKGGIKVSMENREPSARLTGEHEGKLLVMTYPWDSNAHPGNEFWFGSLHTSGDPAAACSTQVSELHNAHINPAVSAYNVRVAGRSGLKTLSEYCLALTA